MIDYTSFYQAIAGTPLAPWCQSMPAVIARRFDARTHGHVEEWRQLLIDLPVLEAGSSDFSSDVVQVGTGDDCDSRHRQQLNASLRRLMPWRKGPFELFGLYIDTEWRSDFKWNRLRPHLASLHGRRVLDVGCGSGYHCLRMYGDGADLVVGVEPLLRYITQFYAIKHYVPDIPVHLLPLSLEGLPERLAVFDTVFSMGVLYHRKSPFDHLYALKELLVPGGELVLETLVVEGGPQAVLTPVGRYAKMRNVWFIPSCAMLEIWLQRCGFTGIRLVDVSVTSIQEQRATEWMQFESLPQFLHPQDPTRTIEGHPAPRRAIFIAAKPS